MPAEIGFLSLTPAGRNAALFSFFLQENIALVADKLRLTVGSKFEHNDYTGFEYQPNMRLLWTPRSWHSAWAAVSRAVRTPSRADQDVRLAILTLPPDSLFAGSLPAIVVGIGSRDVKAEKLLAFEAGYRLRPRNDLLLDIAT
jgi:iron complex outermembrane receptor protein